MGPTTYRCAPTRPHNTSPSPIAVVAIHNLHPPLGRSPYQQRYVHTILIDLYDLVNQAFTNIIDGHLKIFHSLAPGRYGSDFKRTISEHMSQIIFMSISCQLL